jgi:Flp pilus assembly protein CpaB
LLWWAAAISLGLFTASVVGSSVGRTTRAANEWGSARSVWIVRRPVQPGDVFERGDVALTHRPRAVVPRGALDATSSPVGEATRVSVQPGEVVLTDRLAGRGAHGVAAMVAPGFRAVVLKNDDAMPVLRQGDRVDVLATFDVGDELGASTDGAAAPSFAVAADAEVLTVSPRAVTLAVQASDAPRVAFALAKAALTVVLRGPGSAGDVDADHG